MQIRADKGRYGQVRTDKDRQGQIRQIRLIRIAQKGQVRSKYLDPAKGLSVSQSVSPEIRVPVWIIRFPVLKTNFELLG